jgi:hypothetical protein
MSLFRGPAGLETMVLVYRESTPSLAQAGYGKDRRELAFSRIETGPLTEASASQESCLVAKGRAIALA